MPPPAITGTATPGRTEAPPAARGGARGLFRGYGGLVLLWLAIMALPFAWLVTGNYYHCDIAQARKALEYGFWERQGGFPYLEWSAGKLPNPAAHNYVNHPYGLIWLYTLLYWLFGSIGVYGYVALTGLTGSLLTYWFLKRLFPADAAWWGAALYAAAHMSVEFSTNPDPVAQSAFIWPLAALAIVKLRERAGQPGAGGGAGGTGPALALGVIVFLSVLSDWWALTTLPALMLLCVPREQTLWQALRRPLRVRGWVPIVAGGTAGLGVFIGQVLFYSPDLRSNAQYLLGAQIGLGDSFLGTRLHMFPVLVLRMVLAGPALWFGALVCLVQLGRKRAPQERPDQLCPGSSASVPALRVVRTMVLYLAVFCLVMFVIPRFFYLNQCGFRYVLFPGAVLTAFALARLQGARWLRPALGGIAVPALLLCYAKLHDYQESSASVTVGTWLRSQTRPEEVVFTNLKYQYPPVHKWDVEFQSNVRAVSDRLLFSAGDEAELLRQARRYDDAFPGACFLRESGQPLALDLARRIEAGAETVVTTNLVVPAESLRLFKTGRAALWNYLKFYGRPPPSAPETNAFNLTLYRLSPAAVRQLERDLQDAPPKP